MNNTESPISINEHLSALLDDEAGSFEERRVLDELKTDQALTKKLSSFALIGETMRTADSEKPALALGSGFLDSIHEQIAHEDDFNEVIVGAALNVTQTSSTQTSASPLSWLRPVGGFAVAASFGALAFMGLQNVGVITNPESQPSGIVTNSAPTAIAQSSSLKVPVLAVKEVVSVSNDQYADADSQTRSLLKRYVDSHMQYATTSAFVPSVRTIAYTDNQ